MKRYISPITKELTPTDWKDKINLSDMSLDEMTELLADLKVMEAMGKKVGGYMKEAVKARMPEGEMEYIGARFIVTLNDRLRSGGLDGDKILEEMGEDWCEERMKPDIEYTELRLSVVTPE
ncbi:hypothetical protein LCGC14_0481700 [marine sediment metagenome]|uniref:Uncharacterized protein n=1 Tax=marine sediment metagenome TaxID=412755 RepID=A0A0F9S976_9ZZZZ